jgi:hypothetical protein
MTVIIKSLLTSGPVVVPLATGGAVRLSPGQVSPELPDAAVAENAKVDKLLRLGVIGVDTVDPADQAESTTAPADQAESTTAPADQPESTTAPAADSDPAAAADSDPAPAKQAAHSRKRSDSSG